MKLPVINLQSATALEEFDIWITPSLGEIRDTERFRQELDRVVEIFDALSEATAEFNSVETCRPAEIADVAIAKAAKARAITAGLLMRRDVLRESFTLPPPCLP